SHQLAMRFAEGIKNIPGFRVFSSGPILREVVVESPVPVAELQKSLLKDDIDAGFDISKHFSHLGKNLVQFSFTGMNSSMDLTSLLEALEGISEDISKASGIKKDGKKHGDVSEIPESIERNTPFDMPVVSEPILRRIIYKQGKLNYNLTEHPSPSGSVTMMYNPDINESIAGLSGFSEAHPYALSELTQGTLKILHDLAYYLREITGMDDTSLHPAAGAHGEFAGLTAIFRYLESKGKKERNIVITTDSAHGTNPASSAMANAVVVEVKTNSKT
ncbi:unnamed protein product, partial [marine sediment metagenome]